MLNVVKKWQAGILLCGSIFLSYSALAQQEPTGDILEQIKNFFQQEQEKSDQTQREISLDLKKFLGLMQLKDIETQNVMRLMYPPFVDKTMTIGARILAAEDTIRTWQDTLVRDTANYNMNTEESQSNDVAYLGSRMKKGIDTMLDPYIGLNDLLANTLLVGHAFENDAQAEEAYQYIRNVTNFTPIAAMTADEIFSDKEHTTLTDKGASHLMKVYKQLPLMTMAQNSLLAIHAEKQRFHEFAQGLPIGDPETQSASLMEVMAYDVERRYMSTEWVNEMNQMSAEGLLKEIANMLAFQNYLNFKKYEQGQRTEAMLAAQMGMMSAILNMGDLSEIENITPSGLGL